MVIDARAVTTIPVQWCNVMMEGSGVERMMQTTGSAVPEMVPER